MKHSPYPFVFFLAVLICSSPIFGQESNSSAFRLRGNIIAEEEGNPLEYATIALFNTRDSSLVTGTVSGDNGNFTLETGPGDFYLKVSFMGFEPQYVSNIALNNENPSRKIPTIKLRTVNTTLEEVEISAQKNRVQFALDKRIVNVGKDLRTIGGTASDILDNIPSVTVDIEGNVSLRGSDAVRILINGKPSLLSNADALQQLPAEIIDRVEIVTNPSSRYEAEGTAGILNIILKKDKRQGLNGNFNLTLGSPISHNGSFSINHRREKFNLFASAGLRYRESPRYSFEHRELFRDGRTSIIDQYQNAIRGGVSGNFRFGADYQFNKYNTLTASLNWRKSDDFNETDIDFFSMDREDNILGIDVRDSDEEEKEDELDYTISYEKTFEEKGRKWTADLIYSSGIESEATLALEQAFSADRNPLGLPDEQQDIFNSEEQRNWTFQSDYVHPLGENRKFEAGVRGGFRLIDTDYSVDELNIETNIWESVDGLSNRFNYDESILAVYTSFGDKLNKFSYQFGLRGEYTHILTELKDTGEKYDKEYANLFPSIFLSYDLPKENAVQVSYSRRLRRPRFWYLNPFSSFSNPLSIRAGNPDLDPEFSNSFELNYIKYWDKWSLSSSIYYRDTRGVIQRISRLDTSYVSFGQPDTIIRNITRPENLARSQNFGLELSITADVTKWLSTNANLNFYRGIVDGGNQGFNDITRFYSWTARWNTQIKVGKNTEAQLTINYRGPEENPQGKRYDFLYTDIGISRDILKKKATISFRVVDLFKTAIYQYESFGDDFYIFREGQWRTIQQFYFGFVYRLNQKKRKSRSRPTNFNFDE